jgi:hypothetical protein
MKWISLGHLEYFDDPESEKREGKRGPKTIRIWRDSWERYLASRSRFNRPDGSPAPPPASLLAHVGTDGVSRLYKRGRGRARS